MEQQITAMWAQGGVGLSMPADCGELVAYSRTGARHDRQLDMMEAAQREQAERVGTALERQGRALEELRRRTA